MSVGFLRDLLYGLLFLILQLVLIRQLTVFGLQADIVFIYCLYLLSRRDRTTVILLAALLGLTQDALLDLWGFNLISKTLSVYLLTFIIRNSEEIKMPNQQVFLAVFFAFILHNFIYLMIAYFSGNHAIAVAFWKTLLGNSLYSGFIATLLYLLKKS